MFYEYNIDGNYLSIEVPDSTVVSFGEDKCLSKSFGDITSEQSWYDQDFNIPPHPKGVVLNGKTVLLDPLNV